jgi:riboflavin biosynthesis pyrimidine reductase
MASASPPPLLRPLLDAGPPLSVAEVAARLDLRPLEGRPGIAVNMVASVDGRADSAGRSGGLGGPADRALFHALRARVDAVLVGAATAALERYGPIRRDRPAQQPLACLVSRSLALPPDLPLLADPASRVVIITPSAGSLPAVAAQVEYLRGENLADALAQLRERWGVSTLLCEGGPRLNAQLLAEDLIDELLLTISPLLVGGEAPRSILAGGPARRLELADLFGHEGFLFARYRVGRSPLG